MLRSKESQTVFAPAENRYSFHLVFYPVEVLFFRQGGMSQHLSVSLSESNRSFLLDVTRKGSAPARVQTRARILLLSDKSQGAGRTQAQVAHALGVSTATVSTTCRRFAQDGKDAALYERPRPGQKPKITGEVEAQLIMLACSDPPAGKGKWTMQLLADKLVELALVESISDSAICDRLKKTKSNPGR
jgi:transposase